MGSTAILQLPYPELTDTADVPRDVKALADKLDTYTGIKPPVVTSLPGSPVDGQEIYYQVDATNGVIWHLRYRAASSSSYKWELIGGTPLYGSFVAAQAAPIGSWGNGAPQITLPRAGDYLFAFSATVQPSAAALIGLAVYIPAATVAFDVQTAMQAPVGEQFLARADAPLPAAVAGNYQLAFFASVSAQFSRRYLSAIPVRIG